jgi:hypothetical protein
MLARLGTLNIASRPGRRSLGEVGRDALEFCQFPSRFRQSDGRGRPSHIVGAGVPARALVFGHFRRGTNVKPEVGAWIAAQRLNRLALVLL